MWAITVRDLQYRGRQFGIAVAGAGLVFAVTLILTGISHGFRSEARQTVGAIAADRWIVPDGVTGPFTSHSAMPAALAGRVARLRGVTEAHNVVIVSHSARLADGEVKDVNVVGHEIGALGDPRWAAKRPRSRPGQAVVDERLDVGVGGVVRVAGRRLRVARVVSDRTYFAGVPTVYVGLRDARALAFDGRPLASAVVVRGDPRRAPRGHDLLANATVRDDLIRPLHGATVAIDVMRWLMWIVAAVIIGAVTYLSALERVRDFAVLKAVGGSSFSLALSLAAQAVLASVAAAVLAIGLAQLLKPLFPLPVDITVQAYLALPAIAMLVGVLSSLAALRRAVGVDPALAFAG
jgi:putative ABC transport system permease protein